MHLLLEFCPDTKSVNLSNLKNMGYDSVYRTNSRVYMFTHLVLQISIILRKIFSDFTDKNKQDSARYIITKKKYCVPIYIWTGHQCLKFFEIEHN